MSKLAPLDGAIRNILLFLCRILDKLWDFILYNNEYILYKYWEVEKHKSRYIRYIVFQKFSFSDFLI